MIVREATVALSRRQRGDGGADDESESKPADAKTEAPDAKPEVADAKPADAKPADAKPADAKPADAKPADAKDKQDDTTPLPMKPGDAKKSEAKPAAAPAPAPAPAPDLPRAKTETIAMPGGDLGRPPDMPQSVAPPPLAFGTVENPTHMPGPKDIPSGEPNDRAAAPGVVPRGDSRSLRKGGEFALIYRIGTYVISRFGSVGQRGQWRVVEYPTSSAASHSYAKECSRFVTEGFSDYRE